MNYKKTIVNIRIEFSNYLRNNKIEAVVIGISGGMDSCLCAALAKPVCDAVGIPLIGAMLPSDTNQSDEKDRAKLTCDAFCTESKSLPINPFFNSISNIINPDPIIGYNSGENIKSLKIRNGNIKARLRMIILYNLASENRGLVLSTDNYTEYLLGFWTLHGDVGDYGMIQNLYKTEVYDMAEWIAENECKLDESTALTSTIEALATDGLGVTTRGDLGQILPEWQGSSRDGYKEVDRILKLWLERHELGDMQKIVIENTLKDHPVIQRHLRSEFKRNNPINITRNKIINN